MKGFLKPKLILSLVTVLLLAGAIAGPLVGNFIRTHAAGPEGEQTLSISQQTHHDPPDSDSFTGCNAGHLKTDFSPITLPVTIPDKPLQLQYGPLHLNWTPVIPPAASAVCTLTSEKSKSLGLPLILSLPPIGRLAVQNSPLALLPPIQVGVSTAIAKLDFEGPGFGSASIPLCSSLRGAYNNCFLNTPGPHPAVVKWYTDTDGFVEKIGPFVVDKTGPLTFYVDAASLTGGNLAIPQILQPLEQYIHITLITNLPRIRCITVIQEPPNDVLVRDGRGNLTGRLPNRQTLTSIPGSVYLPGTANVGAAVAIFNQPLASYSTEVVGSPGAKYTLVSSHADFSHNGLSPTVTVVKQQGVLGASGVKAGCFSTDVKLHCIGVDIMPGTDINRIDPDENRIVKVALLADNQVHATDIDQSSLRFGANGTEAPAVRCQQQDINGDGLPDLVCDFVVSKADFERGDSFGIVKGRTLQGLRITGSDAIQVDDD